MIRPWKRRALAFTASAAIAGGVAAAWKLRGSMPVPAPPRSSGVIPNDMLNVADPKMGARIAQLCMACHSFHEGGDKGKVGPILFGVVGAPIAGRKDFAYSEALLSLHGRTWTTDALYDWLRDPAGFAPGTRMMFSGILDPQDRMDLISYLMTLK